MRFSTTTLLFTLFLSIALLAVHADAEEAAKASKCRSRMMIKKTKNHPKAAQNYAVQSPNHHKLSHEMQQMNHKQVHEAAKKSPSTQGQSQSEGHGHGHGHKSNATSTASPSSSSPTGTGTSSAQKGTDGQDGQDGADGSSSSTPSSNSDAGDEGEDEDEDENQNQDPSSTGNNGSEQNQDEDENENSNDSSNSTMSGSKKISGTKNGYDGILSIHNAKRAQLSVAPLKWDPTMAAFAKQYASKCHWGHSHNKKYAENIATATGFSSTKSTKLFDMWWQEGKQCDFKTTGCSFSSAGHYVNLINKKYTKLGCGTASCPASFMGGGAKRMSGDAKYLVCEYA